MRADESYIKGIIKEEVNKILFVNPSIENHLYLDYENYQINLNEGIYKTYPPDTARRYVMNLFNLNEKQIIVYGANGKLPEEKRLWVAYYNEYGNKKKMTKAMMLCGYTLSKSMNRDDGLIEEIYSPINLPNINDIVRKYSFITHITPSYNKDKILSKGFIPKSKNEMFSYNDRIFFFKGDTPINEIMFQAFEFDRMLKNKRNEHSYTIFSIDTQKIPDNVNFHTDLTYPCGIYTTENVPPNCIKGYQDFNTISFANKFLNIN
jgi:hypothetical protein